MRRGEEVINMEIDRSRQRRRNNCGNMRHETNDRGYRSEVDSNVAKECDGSRSRFTCRICSVVDVRVICDDERDQSRGQCELCVRLHGPIDFRESTGQKIEENDQPEEEQEQERNYDYDYDYDHDEAEEKVRERDEAGRWSRRRNRTNSNDGGTNASGRPEPLAMDSSRRRSDVGQWLRCASSVVRWGRRHRYVSKHASESTVTLSSFLSPFYSRSWTTRCILVVAFVFALASTISASADQNYHHHRSLVDESRTSSTKGDDVCQSVDVRNSVSQFSRLENCRVVEGFVQILLIDRADDTSYTNLTFPKLVEITGYLLLYRVNGLRSVGHLFPNLAVIRGHSLFINYALVAFEMGHLQEIGLHSLTNIVRGSVRFEKNPSLCYVDTIDWDVIGEAGKGGHFISGNKPRNGCPVCDKDCPMRKGKLDETLCWNRQHCQHVCDSCDGRACMASQECCHPTCTGGCNGTTSYDCKVCKHVVSADNECLESCRPGTYEYLSRRCIDERTCRSMRKPREAFDVVKEYPYKPFNGTCVIECPTGYMDATVKGVATCKKCDGSCLKECSGASVDSIASAQKLRGCTKITGSLEIQIRGGKNIVKELEDSLNMIEEIDGYLKIVRSFPLISLNFLKNLKIIRGKHLESGKYSLVVLDNQNLQELWDLDSHETISVQSKDGPVRVFFHFNPKLCLHTIEKFREAARLPAFTEMEVAPNSNGDKVACNVTKLVTRLTKCTSNAALIEWDGFKHHDPRSLLGYVVYSIEAPNNVTMFDGRDACGGDGWRVDDVNGGDNSEAPTLIQNGTIIEPAPVTFIHILTQLKPYTQYAFYVKTYTIATERSGAQSDLHYFTTLPDAPSMPRFLKVDSNASNEVVVTWEPPEHKNGNLTHYKVIGRWEPDDGNFLGQRNYCYEPPEKVTETKANTVFPDEPTNRPRDDSILGPPGSANTCKCNKEQLDPELENEVASSIAFENALQNQVFVKRSGDRRRRDLSDVTMSTTMAPNQDLDPANSSLPNNLTETADKMVNGTYVRFGRLVYGNTIVAIKDLRHYASYTIEVQACREPVENDTAPKCSTKSIRTVRTLALLGADNIPRNNFSAELIKSNGSSNAVKLAWEEPLEPNGLIVTYQIEYKKIDNQNPGVKPISVCMTRKDFLDSKNMYLLRDLPAGNYSIRLRATSLAGNGDYTESKYVYIIETDGGGALSYLWPILSILALTILCLFGGYVVKRKFMPNVPSLRLIATVNPEYVSTVYVPDEWEVPRKKIELLRELGNGSFGMVYEGVARDVVKGKPEVKCAVKTVNENATDRERIEFLNEASVMKAFNTNHVVRLLGVVSEGQPTLVVMELMVNGDLKTYLRSHRPDVCENFSKQPPTLKRILQMAIEIADGMSYLAAKKFVHRDLAARNCMVAEDMTVKIGDFGMTRDIYETDYYRKGTKGLLPVRWMAPESLKDGVFTSFSDVWSYGVVLWEMVTLASQPYQGLSNDQVLRYVIDGGVMERPENCPDSLYTLMRRTWNHKPNQRPTFIDIATMLLSEVNVEDFERVSFYHSPEGIEARNQNASHSPQTDKDFEMATLNDSPEDEVDGEGGEESPLRQDFGDFANFEPSGPNSIKISSNPIYGATSRNDSSKSGKIATKADFDDFEGASLNSLRSSRHTLDLPFAEDSLNSAKNSPYVEKRDRAPTLRANSSDVSLAFSPQNIAKRNFIESPRFSAINNEDPDYENKAPQVTLDVGGDTSNDGLRRVNANDNRRSSDDYKEKSETMNNGFISGKTTKC